MRGAPVCGTIERVSRPGALIFFGFLALGAAAGLYLGWVVTPVDYIDTAPASLHPAYKDDYTLMVATVYAADGDLEAARARLASLGYADPGAAVTATFQRLQKAGYPAADLERLASLAKVLGAPPP